MQDQRGSSNCVLSNLVSRAKALCKSNGAINWNDKAWSQVATKTRGKFVQLPYASSTTEVLHHSFLEIIGTNVITKIVSTYPSQSGQQITIKKNSVNAVVFNSTDVDNVHESLAGEGNLKYGHLQMLYNDGVDNYALIAIVSPVLLGPFHACFYYYKSSYQTRLAKIMIDAIVSIALEIPSLDPRTPGKINVSWKR
ncbi:hypothetical protein MAM1_1246c11533 [Mucor ambiguus]|uniref:Uncharacterized protein n=1 Tax=Mucor ambiguus TaxID=91626 RepID=A0A0C9NAV2_9FUNG|nr:hypothetical protein MAM1_1246c11533 [Mucor ambiguus]